ncbi:MAG: hypothetical protein U0790_07770 [Isosphaeraceae bacterium]
MTPLLAMLLWAGEPAMSEKIVEYAKSQVGQKVGDGECTSLAVAALRHAGAKVRRRAPVPWGEEVAAFRDVRPGDILQFENAVFVRHRALENGGLLTSTFSYPHHTAIVAAVRKKGPRPILVILHQNVGVDGTDEAEKRLVQQGTLNLAEKRSGTIRIYRPGAE